MPCFYPGLVQVGLCGGFAPHQSLLHYIALSAGVQKEYLEQKLNIEIPRCAICEKTQTITDPELFFGCAPSIALIAVAFYIVYTEAAATSSFIDSSSDVTFIENIENMSSTMCGATIAFLVAAVVVRIIAETVIQLYFPLS